MVGPEAGQATVVLVMTDVAGSTRLWAEHPAGMDTAMGRHHQIVHAAVTAHGGWRPVDQGEGDAVFAVFDSAAAAVAGVVGFQQGLAREVWPTGIDIRVRVGIHAGEVRFRAGNVFGSTVNRCARLRGLGSGGQVLLSAPVFELVRDGLTDGVTAIDLGEHRLKDLTRAEHVHQLVVPGLPSDFPQLASLERARHNLPVETSSFLGRTREIADLVDLVRAERLVTIVGFGGMGKTRLALQVAAELATGDGDGVWFVDLSAVTDAGQVPAVIATVLGVVEGPAGVLASVSAAVASSRLLLVLDNLEQLLPEAALTVDQLLRAGPGIRVLATSREPLRLSGEQEYPLSPLPVPSAPRPGRTVTDAELVSMSTYDAVRLFIRRAAAVRRGFELTASNAGTVPAICFRLDGVPLALELAAARMRVLSPDVLLPRLDHALTVLISGNRELPTRQQTLRATIDWSYDALNLDEQRLLDRLSVFRSSFTLTAAEAVCGPAIAHTQDGRGGPDLDVLAGLSSLVDHNLVIHLPGGAPAADRYTTLVSIHEYAAEQLDRAGHTAVMRDRHARHFTVLTRDRPERTQAEDDSGWELAEQEIAELRAALDHLRLSPAGDGEAALASKTLSILADQGLLTEARATADAALARTAPATADRIELLLYRSTVEWNTGQMADAASYTVAAVSEARALGEPSLLAAALGTVAPSTRAEGRLLLTEGRALLAALPPTGSYWPLWQVRQCWAVITMLFVDPEWAEAVTRRSFDEEKSRGALSGINLGYVLLRHGRLVEAEEVLGPLEQVSTTASVRDQLLSYYEAAVMRLAISDPVSALHDLDRAAHCLEQVDIPGYDTYVAITRAASQRALGDRSGASETLRQLLHDSTDHEAHRVAGSRYLLAVLAREAGDHLQAADHLQQAWAAVAGRDAIGLDLILECLLERVTQLLHSDPEEATRLIGVITAHRGDVTFVHGVSYDSDAMLAGLRATLGDEEVDRILALAATQELPDSPTWPEPVRGLRV